jgi:hypothetical protein
MQEINPSNRPRDASHPREPASPNRKTVVVSYDRSRGAPEVVNVREIDLSAKPQNPLEYFHSMFDGVPLHGGKDWKTRPAAEIADMFRKAAEAIVVDGSAQHDAALQENASRNVMVRLFRKLRGWEAPAVPTLQSVLEGMATRCDDLANWMEHKQHSRFYMGSDMSAYIRTPRRVAELIRSKEEDPVSVNVGGLQVEVKK